MKLFPLTAMPENDVDNEEGQLRARLSANLQAADAAMTEAMADPWVRGSKGQKRAHPGFAVAERCDRLVLDLEARLAVLRERREQEAELAKGLTTDAPRLG